MANFSGITGENQKKIPPEAVPFSRPQGSTGPQDGAKISKEPKIQAAIPEIPETRSLAPSPQVERERAAQNLILKLRNQSAPNLAVEAQKAANFFRESPLTQVIPQTHGGFRRPNPGLGPGMASPSGDQGSPSARSQVVGFETVARTAGAGDNEKRSGVSSRTPGVIPEGEKSGAGGSNGLTGAEQAPTLDQLNRRDIPPPVDVRSRLLPKKPVHSLDLVL